ncbi:hypothetical protein [Kineococcus rhizosphaerae]|uniref:hypothetical protein n=1 Tax=Kineococcus rhizosphaerae TaxID=559628 RepID=UPI0011B1DF17|nr:hypothetical protein [Kineococcus rhizosphaerae]
MATPPWEEDLLVTAQPQGVVDVWSLRRDAPRGERCATFETVWDIGGWRGVLVPGECPVVVASAWERHGVCGYDLSGQQLWQDRSRTNVNAVTALPDGRVVVTYGRRATRVLEAVSGQEVRVLRGVLKLIPLTMDAHWWSAAGGVVYWIVRWSRWGPGSRRDWVRSGSRRATESTWPLRTTGSCASSIPTVVSAWGGRSPAPPGARFSERDLGDDPRDLARAGVAGRFDDDAVVLEERACERPRDVAVMGGGRALVVLVDAGVQVVDCSNWSTRVLVEA